MAIHPRRERGWTADERVSPFRTKQMRLPTCISRESGDGSVSHRNQLPPFRSVDSAYVSCSLGLVSEFPISKSCREIVPPLLVLYHSRPVSLIERLNSTEIAPD